MADRADTVVIACGALAREISALVKLNGWRHLKIQCLPAKLHNTPAEIAPAVQKKITECKQQGYQNLFVAYGDCGTGGELDRVLAQEAVERLPGPHCYSFFAGAEKFDALHDAEFGTFYLTDFLTRHFDRLILRDMGIDRHPELLSMYFGNYKKLVYLSQINDPQLVEMAEAAAKKLSLEFEHHPTGYGEMETSLQSVADKINQEPIQWHA